MNGKHSDLFPGSANGRCTRRNFLLTALLGLTAGSIAVARTPVDTVPDHCEEPLWLRKFIGDRQSAARIGRAYLDAHPGDRQCHRLIAEIERGLKRQDASFSPTAGAEQTARAVQRLVRTEYACGDVVSVAGWVLSKTEARLYALVCAGCNCVYFACFRQPDNCSGLISRLQRRQHLPA